MAEDAIVESRKILIGGARNTAINYKSIKIEGGRFQCQEMIQLAFPSLYVLHLDFSTDLVSL
jgi:hypothetical protein